MEGRLPMGVSLSMLAEVSQENPLQKDSPSAHITTAPQHRVYVWKLETLTCPCQRKAINFPANPNIPQIPQGCIWVSRKPHLSLLIQTYPLRSLGHVWVSKGSEAGACKAWRTWFSPVIPGARRTRCLKPAWSLGQLPAACALQP